MITRMLKIMGGVLATAAIITLAGCNGAQDNDTDGEEVVAFVDAVENQQYCPVMENNPIDKDIYVDHEGQRVYFCCPACIPVFMEDPDTYMAKLKERHENQDREPHHENHGHDHDHDHGNDHDHDHGNYNNEMT